MCLLHHIAGALPAIDSAHGVNQKRQGWLLLVFAGVLILLQAGCSRETHKALSDLSSLREALVKEYKEEDINLTVHNSRILQISFINSAFNKLDQQSQQRKAREIALFAKTHYASIDRMDGIGVSFVIYHNYIIFHYTNSLASFFFKTRNLDPSAPPDEPAPNGVVIARYNADSRQTDVYLAKNLQLYNTTGGGMSVFVHLKVHEGEKSEPEWVDFEFTTDSTKKMFSGDPNLLILANGQVIFSGKARLKNTLGAESEGAVNQLLAGQISYDQFVKLASGRKVTLTMGSNRFELTDKQLTALRAMKRCVDDAAC